MTYTNWGPGEPNNAAYIANEDRMCLFGENQLIGPYWDDMPSEIMIGVSVPKGYIVEYNTNPIPEPSTLVLLGMGAVGLATYAWRRRKRTA